MCGRVFIDPGDGYFRDLAEYINRSPLMAKMNGTLPLNADGVYGGEVPPGSVMPVLAPNRAGEQAVFPMKWGFSLPGGEGKRPGTVINARTETAAVKPLFRDLWKQRRCVIPASAYFEWEHYMGFDGKPKTGRKYKIRPAEGKRTCLAGLYRIEDGIPAFVVLTRAPSAELFRIHDRMPLMIPEEAVGEWLSPTGRAEEVAARALTDTVMEAV